MTKECQNKLYDYGKETRFIGANQKKRRGRKQAVTNKNIKRAREALRKMSYYSLSWLMYLIKINKMEVAEQIEQILEQKGYITKDIPHFGRFINI
jgi:ribosomal protein S25